MYLHNKFIAALKICKIQSLEGIKQNFWNFQARFGNNSILYEADGALTFSSPQRNLCEARSQIVDKKTV